MILLNRSRQGLLIAIGMILCLISIPFLLIQSSRLRPGELFAKTQSLECQSIEEKSTHAWANGVATFEVENRGQTPVRVLSIEKGCGCVTAEMRSDVILPGQRGFLDVTATPLVIGEKRVSIRLCTDSIVKPSLEFDLKVIGSRKPPYLLSTSGDLTFNDLEPGGFEEFEATTVARIGDDLDPQIEFDFPFLKVDKEKLTQKPSADDQNVLYNLHRYRISIIKDIPDQFFGGVVRVRDPWIADRLLTVPIEGRAKPRIRAVPNRLHFDMTKRDDQTREQKFLVIRRIVGGQTRVEIERESDSPLILDRLPQTDGSTVEGFRVRLKQGFQGQHQGIFNLIIHESDGNSSAIILPVEIHGGGSS